MKCVACFVAVATVTCILTQGFILVASISLIERPQDVVAAVGESVEFTCETTEPTPVNWDYRQSPNSVIQRIVYGGQLDDDLKWKYEAKANGVYKLKLLNVNASDAGRYICTDKAGIGDSATAMLIVLEKLPRCSVNVTEINYVHANLCDKDQPDYANVSCSVAYRGNSPPVLMLRNVDGSKFNESIVFTFASDTHAVASVLLPVNTIQDGASYSCEVSASAVSDHQDRRHHGHQYQCQTPVIDAESNYNTGEQFTCHMDSFDCSPCVNPPCSYRWIDRRSNEVVSLERRLSLREVDGRNYAYQCQIVCDVEGKRYTSDSDSITCLEHSRMFSKHHMVLYPLFGLLTLVLLAGMMVVCICLCRATSRERVYSKDAELGYSNHNLLKQPIDNRLVVYGVESKPKADVGEPTEPCNIDKLPLELREILLMKTGVSYFRFHWQMFRELKTREILEYLAVVCVAWQRAVTQRSWFSKTLRRRLDHVCAPYKRRVRRTTTLDTMGNGVTGVTQLLDHIYAVCYESDRIRVFLARPPFTRLDDIEVPDMKTPHDIAACNANKCLYICDLNGNCVWRVTDDHKIDKWLDQIIHPYTISVGPKDGRVLLVSIRSKRLSVYRPNAQLITNIDMLNESDLRHAVCTSRGTYIMSQKTLLEVDRGGHRMRNYIGDREPENLNCPVYMALDPDSENGLFVLDYVNHRILQFNTNLKLIRCVADKGLMNHENPMWRLCYAKGQMMIGMEHNGNIEVYGML